MMPHFKAQSRMKHVVRSHLLSPSHRSRGFSLGYRGVTALIAIGIGSLALLVAEFSGRGELKAEEKAFLERYEIIRSKLAHDDLAGARAESSVLTRSLRRRSGRAAKLIVESKTLETARLGFAELSRQAVKVVRNREGYYVLSCPPVGCPQKCKKCPMSRFGDWVQTNPAVENPFIGADQTGCGLVRE